MIHYTHQSMKRYLYLHRYTSVHNDTKDGCIDSVVVITRQWDTYPCPGQNWLLAAQGTSDGQALRRQIVCQTAEAERMKAWQHLGNDMNEKFWLGTM